MLDVMMDELKTATRDFYNLTGIKIVLYDKTRRYLYSYPESMCDFCKTVRTNDTLRQRCLLFDNIGFDTCERTRMPHIYQCHMGLLEAITPICEGDEIIGYMMMGQVLREGEHEAVQCAIRAAVAEFDMDAERFEKDLKKMESLSDSTVRSALHIMSMCVCYLYTNQIIKSRSEELSDRLRRYIDLHYTEPLTVPSLCRMLYISKSKLYQISRDAFGMGVSDYIRRLRMERAKQLLQDGKLPIWQIAEQVGIHDANYFIRAFKADVGTTPLSYRMQYNKK